LPAKLGIDPLHPFVYAVADPGNLLGSGDIQDRMAFFHKYVLGVVTHGLETSTPAWVGDMATSLEQTDHYQKAIAFDWTQLSQSDAPGATAQAAAMMASTIESAAQALATSPTDVVDIHLISHSRGAVVISEALADLFGPSATVMPALSAGYKKVTLLDPHPAQQAAARPNGQPVEQWFSPGTNAFLSAAAISVLNSFQSTADDSPVVIPKSVDSTEVFYQHTPTSMLSSSATATGEASVVNLWGQVPVIAGAVHYYDLTGPNIGHSEVWMWYRDNVILPDALNAIPSTNPGLHIPAVNIESAYLGQAYEDVLGRPVDAGGLTNWVPQLNSGVPRGTVIAALDHSAEYFSTVIAPLYSRYLSRAPDTQGISFWIDQMQNHGLTDERLEADFIGSPEFYAKAGGTDKLWVDAMYLDLLGRPADPAGEAFWIGQLAQGVQRSDAAFGFAAGLEREGQRINEDYLRYLGRAAEQAGLDFWVSQFAKGSTNEDLITGFVASDEYFNKHTS
jgi:hypothetical protein